MRFPNITCILVALSISLCFTQAQDQAQFITLIENSATPIEALIENNAAPIETITTKPACDRNDINLDGCLKSLIQNQLSASISNTLDPWSLPRTKYLYQTLNGIRMVLTTENVQFHGLKRISIVNVQTKFLTGNKTNGNGVIVEGIVHFPKIRMSGNYSAKIRVNELKLKPKGRFNITVVNVINNIKLIGTVETKHSQRYLHLTKFVLDPLFEDIRFNITGIFPSDQQMNSLFVNFINSYWRNLFPIIIRETRPDLEAMLLNATNEFLDDYPFDNLIRN